MARMEVVIATYVFPRLGLARLLVLGCTLLTAGAAVAAEYADSWGPNLGAQISLDAPDQSGQPRSVADLSGEKGLLIVLLRSADW